MNPEEIPDSMAGEPHEDSPYTARPASTAPHFPAPGAVFDPSYDPLRDYDQNGEPDEALASVWSRRSFAQALLAAVHEREKEIAKAFAGKLCEGSVSLIKLTVELERESAEEERRAEERRAPTLSQALLPLLRRDLIPQKEAERKAAQAIKPWETPGYGQDGFDLKAMCERMTETMVCFMNEIEARSCQTHPPAPPADPGVTPDATTGATTEVDLKAIQESPMHRRLFPTRARRRARLARPMPWRRSSLADTHAPRENASGHAGHFSACAAMAVELTSPQSMFTPGVIRASCPASAFHQRTATTLRRETPDRMAENAFTGGTPPHGIRFRLRAATGANRSRASRGTPQASPPATHDGYGDVRDRAKPSSLHRRGRRDDRAVRAGRVGDVS